MTKLKRKASPAEVEAMMAAYDAWSAKTPLPEPAASDLPAGEAAVKEVAKDISRFFEAHPELGWGLDAYADHVNFYRVTRH
jgi:hypothetical protein